VDFIKFYLFSSILIYLWLFQSSIINMSSFKPGAVFNPRDNTNRGRKQSKKKMIQRAFIGIFTIGYKIFTCNFVSTNLEVRCD
jgi:hypothetical protein